MTFDISIGKHRNAKSWRNTHMEWVRLLERCGITHRTAETYAEYLAAPKSRQEEIKDVGGFVGGYLTNGSRKKDKVAHRQLVTLDVDYATTAWENFKMLLDCKALCYSTHKHSPDNKRLRIIVPLDREVSVAEYEPIARKVASIIDIEQLDHTTFDINRLMYWPSTSSNGEFFFDHQDGEELCADEVLAMYTDWKDVSEWPQSESEVKAIFHGIRRQGDPLEKDGPVGAWCRTYSIHDVIEKFLSDAYDPCDVENRYTYKGGSTYGGMVTYEDKFSFSHHSTDPTSGKLCNAFDLVRIHKFGMQDDNVKEDTPSNKLPSYQAMLDFVTKDPEARKTMAAEKLQEAGVDFAEEGDDWLALMDVDRKGNFHSTIKNVTLILQHDPALKGCIAMDLFEKREVALRDLPWRKVGELDKYLTDTDEANFRNYLEANFDITSTQKIKDGEDIVLNQNGFHPVKEYLNSLHWDGNNRIEKLLVEYLGVEDHPYTQAVIRKALAAAVTRIFKPGCKFDYVLTFVGEEGLKKSSLISVLGGKWFSESLGSIDKPKEAMESLQGVWLVEMGELASMKKTDVETAKQFIAKRIDRFRVAYGRRSENFHRQCVFFATTNEFDFLKGVNGNRRFWPVLIRKEHILKNPLEDISEYERDQIWAEAVELYRQNEPLYLNEDLEAYAKQMQEIHSEKDERIGVIQKYLDMLLPKNWEEMGDFARQNFVNSGADGDLQPRGTIVRDRVSAAEIWCEAFGGTRKEMTAHNTRFIHEAMRKMVGWEAYKSRTIFKGYGNQRGYYRNPDFFQKTGKNTEFLTKANTTDTTVSLP